MTISRLNKMIALGATNKQPKRISFDVLIICLIVALMCYFIFSSPLFHLESLASASFWIIIIFFALPQFIISYIRNNFVSFIIDNNKITINRGVIIKKSNSANFNLITNVTTSRNIFDLMTGISGITIWTAATGSGDTLYLEKKDAEWLKNHILGNRDKSQ